MTQPLVTDPGTGDVRTAILDAAEVEIGGDGGGTMSLRAVARRAGVSHQTPAYFFANRRGLLTAVAVRGIDRLTDRMLEVAGRAAGDVPLERLGKLGIAYVEFGQQNPGLFTLAASPDQIDRDDDALSEARDRAFAVLREAVAEAQQAGWRAGQSTAIVAMASWALVHGITALWREGWLRDELAERTLGDFVLEVMLNTL